MWSGGERRQNGCEPTQVSKLEGNERYRTDKKNIIWCTYTNGFSPSRRGKKKKIYSKDVLTCIVAVADGVVKGDQEFSTIGRRVTVLEFRETFSPLFFFFI